MSEPAYELKVASHDLKPAETYHQLCQSLQLLSETCDVIFDTIGKRVEAEKQKLGHLASRIQSAQVRVEEIAGSSKATTIFSSSKYPAPSVPFADHSCLFQAHQGKHGRTLPPPPPNGDWKSAPRGSEEALELFCFFTNTANEPVPRQHQPMVGLGSVPASLRSVADMLLFNSSELPHSKYVVVDNLVGGDYGSPWRESRAAAAEDSLLPPPTSIFDSQTSRGGVSDGFGFKPTLGDVPTFSLPSMLPDLPMAADISWSGTLGNPDDLPSIAPSAGAAQRSPKAPLPASLTPGSSPARPPPPLQHSPEPKNKAPSPLPRSSSATPPQQSPAVRPETPTSRHLDRTPSSHDHLQPKPQEPSPAVQQAFPAAAEPAALLLPSSQPVPGTAPAVPLPEPKKAPSLAPSTAAAASLPPPPHPPPPPPPPPPPAGLTTLKKSATIGPGATAGERAGSSTAQLPQLDSVREALMASIRNPSINLRKTGKALDAGNSGRPTLDRRGTAPPLRSGKPGVVDIFSEMASSLAMRRLSMQGSTVGSQQGQGKPSLSTLEDDEPSGDISRHQSVNDSDTLQLPIANVRAYITRKDAAESDDDDDDWEDD